MRVSRVVTAPGIKMTSHAAKIGNVNERILSDWLLALLGCLKQAEILGGRCPTPASFAGREGFLHINTER